MDAVEETVTLPADASSIDRYSRYYARRPDGTIAARYVIHSEGWFDEVRQACMEQDVREFPCGPNGRVDLVPAGQRKWVDDYRALPDGSGGGCGQINIEFDANASKVKRLECNGSY